MRKFPGKVSYPDITLKWGMTDNQELYDWHRQAVKGTSQRKSGRWCNSTTPARRNSRWNFFNAWPSKWDGPAYNAKGNDAFNRDADTELRAG